MAATATALATAALAVLALRPSSKTAVPLAARNPAVEVRTVVIRRTIHIVKHEHAPGTPGLNGHGPTPSRAGTAPRTSTSGSHAAGSPAATAGTVSTRTSGSHGVAAAPGTAPVTTRTSRASGSSPVGSSGKPISTRTSASGGGHGGEGGDGGNGSGGGDN
jgi:hypothetical protein